MAISAGEAYIELRTHDSGLIAGLHRARGETLKTMGDMRSGWNKGTGDMVNYTRRDVSEITREFGVAGGRINDVFFNVINAGSVNASAAVKSLGGALALVGTAIAGFKLGEKFYSWISGSAEETKKLERRNKEVLALMDEQERIDAARLLGAERIVDVEEKDIRNKKELAKAEERIQEIIKREEAKPEYQELIRADTYEKQMRLAKEDIKLIEYATRIVLKNIAEEKKARKEEEEDKKRASESAFQAEMRQWKLRQEIRKGMEEAAQEERETQLQEDLKSLDKFQIDLTGARAEGMGGAIQESPLKNVLEEARAEYARQLQVEATERSDKELLRKREKELRTLQTERAGLAERPSAQWMGAEDIWRTSMAASATSERNSQLEKLNEQIKYLKELVEIARKPVESEAA